MAFDITHQDLVERMGYHPASPSAAVAHDHLRSAAIECGDHFINVLPTCRETSLAITHLEEALKWANTAIAMQGPVDLVNPGVARVLPPE